MRIIRDIGVFWKTYLFFLTPFVLLPLPLYYNHQEEALCGYGVIIMAVYWVTECIPLSVTALLPPVLFSTLGLMKSSDIATNYIKDSSLLFLGGLMVAVSIEQSNLHHRMALGILKIVGSKPKWILFGFMLPSWFISMWINNTATTAMVLPVAEAVMKEFKDLQNIQSDKEMKNNKDQSERKPTPENKTKEQTNCELRDKEVKIDVEFSKIDHKYEKFKDLSKVKVDVELSTMNNDCEAYTDSSHDEKHVNDFNKALSLAILYAVHAGGIATLTGTIPNGVLKGQIDELYKSHNLESPLTFSSWMVYGLPCSILFLFIMWFWLQLFYLGTEATCVCCRKQEHNENTEEDIHQIIQKSYEKLGPLRFAEITNILLFIILVCFWITRKLEMFIGWGQLFKPGYISDSTAVLFVVILLFVIPSEKPNFRCWLAPGSKVETVPALLNWKIIHKKVSWSVIILLGGGFALADVSQKSGLSLLVGKQCHGLGDLPGWLMVLIVVSVVSSCTEITSNTAIITLFLPILQGMTETMNIHPLYLMLPATIATCLAFMLPVSSPPNAIVISYGQLRVIDMVKVGLPIKIMCIVVIVLGTHVWGDAYFKFDEVPWGNSTQALNE